MGRFVLERNTFQSEILSTILPLFESASMYLKSRISSAQYFYSYKVFLLVSLCNLIPIENPIDDRKQLSFLEERSALAPELGC